MADPYRDVAAGDQLAALKALPAPTMNRVLAALMVYRAWPFAVFVPPQTKESIEGAGMRYLGNRVEAVLVPMTSEVWTDREQTTQVSASLRGYWMCTYFESGTCILTWDHVPKTQPNEHLEVYGTEESFTLDYKAHLRAVKRKRAPARCRSWSPT